MKLVVIGGGLIGLGVAGSWAADHDVILLEKGTCGREASHAAAGMLGPVMEVEFNEPEQLRLNKRSHELYPDFVRRLEDETGVDTGFRTEGTYFVAVDPPEQEDLERLWKYQKRMDLDVEKVDVATCREDEPRLSNYISRAMFTESDFQVDNRKLVEALKTRCQRRGVTIREQEPVRRLHYEGDRVASVETERDRYTADYFLLAAGAWSARIEGLRDQDRMPVRPVKGQALSVQLSDPPEVRHVIRSPEVYCVPKDDGRMVIGATMEEEGFDGRVTAGAVLDLLHKAYELLPFVYEQELLETWAGFRPASRDSLPILGPGRATENLVFATGHYRNGVLLTPITIQLLSSWLDQKDIPELMEPFLPGRFQGEDQ